MSLKPNLNHDFGLNLCSYYKAFAGNMSNKYKEVYEATGEVLGMLLSTMQNSNHVSVIISVRILLIILNLLVSVC